MKFFKFKSLTMRIWTTFTFIILIIICSISFLYLVAVRSYNDNAKIQDLKVVHDMILKGDNSNAPNRFDEFKNLKGSENFIVRKGSSNTTDIQDMIKARNGNPPPGGDNGHLPPNINGTDLKEWMASYISGNNIYEEVHKASYGNMKFTFIISSMESQNGDKAYLITFIPNIQDNTILYTVIIIGLVFIAIGFLTAKLVANYISKPLKELEDHTVRIAHKDWKEPIIIKNEDEIGRLAEAMNRMQKELKIADQEEKMFLQSISHDLKTPVMVIMSHAEAIIDGVYIDSVEKTAEIIKEEAISLEKKIKQLLYLNTLDYVLGNGNEDSEFNLNELLIHIISRLEVVNSKIEWDLDLDKISINGNKDKIKVAIENILENGLRYAESTIKVKLKKENESAILEIYNDGPNIPEKSINHIFENLYKDKTGNFGLGLAITKKIIDFYNGEIKAVNRDNGVSFIIKYPLKDK
ncbi:sensor histidine kinase [Clostridium paridis]|uniref:histidine kinase n=1 Tax=Clostridium paridis TaxID=2803863 RepID=A0A937K5I4_9CLOT|nr:HAMP domain-containing sensor histidine kinase [Clostridium paridis]MBL4933747.1 HAMP domain-containing histidine kinase [Clostridium paridis]